MHKKGFSVVELLVVVAIVGVLASVGTVGYQDYVESTKRKVLINMHKQIVRTVEAEFIFLIGNLNL